jgi:hypothetical protein
MEQMRLKSWFGDAVTVIRNMRVNNNFHVNREETRSEKVCGVSLLGIQMRSFVVAG